MRLASTLLAAGFGLLFSFAAASQSCDSVPLPEANSKAQWYCDTGGDTVIVFVHGFNSSNRTAWLQQEAKTPDHYTYWPKLVLGDETLEGPPKSGKKPSVFLAGFYTGLDSTSFGMRDAAGQLYTALQMFGVNQYAEPEIGDALVQFNDEAEKKSEEIKTAKREDEVVRREEAGEQPSPATLPPEGRDIWNFHWAGVIMKDGLDYVTLENLSVEFTSVKNDLWYFAMYGPLEQSFHSEAARDTHVGNWPTTVKFRFQG